MSKGKKKAVTLAVLCVLLLAGICAYFMLPEGEDEESAENGSQETISLVSIDKENASSIHISSGDKEEISLTHEGEAWRLADLPDAPVVQETVAGMLDKVAPVTALGELEASELSEYGLDAPSIVVKIGVSGGQEYELKFGDAVPTEEGYYGLCGDSGKVYKFASSLYSAFDLEKNALIEKEEIADINEEYLMSISVQKGGKDTFRAEIVPDDKKVDAYTNWVISKPYEKLLAGASTQEWSTLQEKFTSVSFEKLVDYKCSDLGKYGLEKPSASVEVQYFELKDGYQIPEETAEPDNSSKSIHNANKTNVVPDEYKDKKSYKLLFGGQTDDGSYYVCMEGSDQVYAMAAGSAEGMFDIDAYTYMDHCVYATLATDITGYDVTIGKQKISAAQTTVKGEDGQDKNVWTLNGKTVPEDKVEEFLTPYTKMFLLEFTSEAKDSVRPKNRKPVIEIVYHEENRDVTVKYLPYDGTNFYRVDKDGMDYFLVDKRSVDDAAAAFESLLTLDLSE